MSANAKQVAGGHYKTDGIQHWDLVVDHDVFYLEGCATKYLTRFRRKNGLEDLQKALHYVEKMIEKYARVYRAAGDVPQDTLYTFFLDNGIGGPEREPLSLIFNWTSVQDLKVARIWVEALIAEYEGSAPGASYVNQK